MKTSIRIAVAACAGLAALAFTSAAWASYMPVLTATAVSNAPGKPTTMLLGHFQSADDDATAKDTIYVPLGYTVTLTQAVGKQIGTVRGDVIFRQGGNTTAAIAGAVKVDDPANYPPATNQCTPGQPAHEAVWRLDVMIAGSPLSVPIYVDHVTTGPEALFASAKLQLCLAGPIGTPLGAQLLDALFDVRGVFRNPPNRTDRVWHGLFTPYIPGQPTPNPGGTTEGQAVSPGRVSLTMTVKRLKHRVVLLQGRLLVDGQPIAGVEVDIVSGTKTYKTKTNHSGRYTLRKRLKRKARFHAEVVDVEALPSCPAPMVGAPQGCKTATLSFAALSNSVLARPRR